MPVIDELAAESATLAAAERHMEGPRRCRDCAHCAALDLGGGRRSHACCVDRDDGSGGALYGVDPDEDQAWDGGCDLWEPERPRAWRATAPLAPIATRDTMRAASALGLGDLFSLGA
jgi:hypothetical protein